MPLTMAEIGKPQYIKQINGKDDTRRFLENLGFTSGGKIVVISKMSGNLIVNVKDVRVAISKVMANRIILN